MALLPGSSAFVPRDAAATPEAPEAASEGVRRKGKVWVNVTPDEERTLEQWAARAGKPLAVLVRDAALQAASAGK